MNNCGCKRPAFGPEPHAPVPLHGGGFVPNAIEWLKEKIDKLFGTAVFTVNGHEPEGGNVDVIVPSKVSELENDAGYLTEHQDVSGIAATAEEALSVATDAAENSVRIVNGKTPTAGSVKIVLDDLADKDGNIETTKTLMVSRDGGESHVAVALLSDLTSEIDTHNNDVRAHTQLVATIARNYATKTEVDAKADKSALDNHEGNTNNPHKVTAAQVGAVPFIVDSSGNKTAVTIGSRKSVSIVGEGSLANGIDVTASEFYSHAEGQETNASGPLSHAEGFVTTAEGFASHTEGGKARTLSGHTFAYAWNGDNSRSEDNPYTSHGAGTYNINPNGGLGGFWIGEQTLAAILADAVKNKVGSFESVGGASATVENGVANLHDFFTESNSLLTATIDARLPYSLYAVPSTGLLKDCAINTTSLASVTVPDNFTDLLIRASVASSLAVTMPGAIATKYGDAFPGEAGEYLITITKTGAAEAYVRTIKLEVANA